MPATLNEPQVEELTQKLGHEMFERMRGASPRCYQFAWWQERMLRICMQDEWFKVQAFRFIDVLPMMQTSADVARHLKEHELNQASNSTNKIAACLVSPLPVWHGAGCHRHAAWRWP